MYFERTFVDVGTYIDIIKDHYSYDKISMCQQNFILCDCTDYIANHWGQKCYVGLSLLSKAVVHSFFKVKVQTTMQSIKDVHSYSQLGNWYVAMSD
jgi:hypothetical protein